MIEFYIIYVYYTMFTHTHMRRMFLAGLVVIVSLFALPSTSAQEGILMSFPNVWPQFQPTSFPIWFIGWGNSYAGVVIITAIDVLSTARNVNFDNATYQFNCNRQIKWWYFNAARGIWLVPLQPGWPVDVQGGLYTQCEDATASTLPSIAPNHIIGHIEYSLWWASLGDVVFGNTITPTEIAANSYNPDYNNGAVQWLNLGWTELQLFGAFFDTMLGIGVLNGWGTGNATDLIGTFNKIRIQWFAGLGTSVEWSERQILTSTLAGTKTLLNTSQEVNNATIINTASRNSTQLCRGDVSTNSNVVCIPPNEDLSIDSQDIISNRGKDIIVNGGDVFITRDAYNTLADIPISLFIKNGNLIFENSIDSWMLRWVDNNGFQTLTAPVTKGIYLQGNFIVDGLILWGTSLIDFNTSIPFRTYIHGRVASLNTFTSVSTQRVWFLQTKIPERSTLQGSQYGETFPWWVWSPSMEEIFSFGCTDAGSGSILSGFTDSSTISAVQSISCPVGHQYPLMIVEKNIPTLLLR